MPSRVRLPKSVDKECRKLCLAINRVPGLRTYESCCGHGRHPFWVWFYAENVQDLIPLAMAIRRDPDWECLVGHNDKLFMSEKWRSGTIDFWLRSTHTGNQAYDDASYLAEEILLNLKHTLVKP